MEGIFCIIGTLYKKTEVESFVEEVSFGKSRSYNTKRLKAANSESCEHPKPGQTKPREAGSVEKSNQNDKDKNNEYFLLLN